MKRILAFSLVLAVLSSGFCFAAAPKTTQTSEPVPISLDTIESLWTKQSPELTKLKSELAISRRSYDDLSDSMERADENNNYATLNSLLSGRDQAKLAYDVATLQYDQKVKNAILSAKEAFLLCWQDQLNLASAKAKLAQKQDQLQRNAQGVQNGYLSQKSYDDLKNAVDDLKNNVTTLKTKFETDEATLKTKLGLNLNANIVYTYPDLNEMAFQSLMNVNPETDLAAMQTNSVNLKVLQVTHDSLQRYIRSYTNGTQVEGALVNLETAKKNLPANYTAQYQRMISQYQDLQNEYRKLGIQKDKLDKTQKQFEMGFVSSLALSNAKLDLSTQETVVKLKECSLYDTYLIYTNMVSGN